MILGALIQTSAFASLLKKTWDAYCSTERRMGEIYKNSRTNMRAERLWDRIKVCFSESFFGRTAKISEDSNFQVFNESKVVRRLLSLYNKRKGNLILYLTTSKSVNLIEAAKREFYISSVKTASIIIIIATATNISMSISLNKEISLWGWFLCLALLFAGLSGIFCDVDLKNLISTSLFLKWINRYKPSELEEE